MTHSQADMVAARSSAQLTNLVHDGRICVRTHIRTNLGFLHSSSIGVHRVHLRASSTPRRESGKVAALVQQIRNPPARTFSRSAHMLHVGLGCLVSRLDC